jgi:hypothetical protein
MSYNYPNHGMYSGGAPALGFGNSEFSTITDMSELGCAPTKAFSGPLSHTELCGDDEVGHPSNVASAQEVTTVSTLVGYSSSRKDMWNLCYDVSSDTTTSQTFHAKCDNVGAAFVSSV